MTTIEIPAAHGQALAARKADLEQLRIQFGIMLREDRRHVDALLMTAAHDPKKWGQYELRIEDGHYLLDLQPAAQQAMTPGPDAQQQAAATNGAPQPPADVQPGALAN